MAVKLFVFNRYGCVFEVLGDIFPLHGDAVFAFKNVVEVLAVSVQDDGRKAFTSLHFIRTGQIFGIPGKKEAHKKYRCDNEKKGGSGKSCPCA